MRIYGMGGTGLNLVSAYAKKNLNVDTCYIDGSSANLRNVDSDQVYLIEGMEGAGKKRSNTHECFKQDGGVDPVRDALIQFPPSDVINVIVTSLSGGSGSTIAPMVVKALLEKKAPVIVVAVESGRSLIELENMIKTYKSFNGASNMTDRPVAIFRVDRPSRSQADKAVIAFLEIISLITNKDETEEFDRTDLFNFINYNEVTQQEASISFIEIPEDGIVQLQKGTKVVSSILVTTDPDTTLEEPMPEYDTTCILVDKESPVKKLRIDNVLGAPFLVIKDFEDKVKELTDNSAINRVKAVTSQSNTDDGFMII